MSTVNAYLTFEGNCEKAFNFYKSVFGGEFSYVGRFKEMPADQPLAPEDQEKIMHMSLPIGNTVLMGSDAAGEWGGNTIMGTNISLSINTDSKEEADRLYDGLSKGGRATMPMDKTFWGSYFGMFTDQFGINWMVSFDETPQP
ncbi:MAG TPA: VOC family protein [Saprospiraceae bacterium]